MCAPDVREARDKLITAAKEMAPGEWWKDEQMEHYPEEWLRLARAIRAYDLARED